MRVLLLADSSPAIGSGHAMRTLVLARELIDLGHWASVVGTGLESIGSNVGSLQMVPKLECRRAFDFEERVQVISTVAPDLVIIDGYEFPHRLFSFLEIRKIPYGIIDDFGKSNATNPLFVIDQNSESARQIYLPKYPVSRIWTGSKFRLLRKEFLEAGEATYSSLEAPFVMIAFGGSDVRNLSVPCARLLSEAGINVRVALGPDTKKSSANVAQMQRLSGVSLIEQSAYEITLANSRLALLSAGTSIWESLALGIPTVGVVVARNQRRGARAEAQDNPLLNIVDVRHSLFFRRKIRDLVISLYTQTSSGHSYSKPELKHTANYAASHIDSLIGSEH